MESARQGDNDETDTMVEYIALHGTSPKLAAFLIEHRVAAISLAEFQELGIAYQEAHGRMDDDQNKLSKEMTTARGVPRLHVNIEEEDFHREPATHV